MHPYYSPAGDTTGAEIMSMAAYLVFWGIVVVVAAREVNRRFPTTAASNRGAPDHALVTLRQRYAAGEITRDEFWQIAHDLACAQLPTARDPA